MGQLVPNQKIVLLTIKMFYEVFIILFIFKIIKNCSGKNLIE